MRLHHSLSFRISKRFLSDEKARHLILSRPAFSFFEPNGFPTQKTAQSSNLGRGASSAPAFGHDSATLLQATSTTVTRKIPSGRGRLIAKRRRE
jgi:hypothetical protein